MIYSTDRILTTHAGSLPRPTDLRDMVMARSAFSQNLPQILKRHSGTL